MAEFASKNPKKSFFHKRLKGSQLVILMLLIASLFAVKPAASDPEATVSLQPSSIADPDLVAGATFTVNITVTDVVGLYGFDVKLGYVTSVLTATEIVLGDFFPPDAWVIKQEIDDTAGADPPDKGGHPDRGYAWLAVTLPFGTQEGIDGSGTLATVSFTVDTLGETVLHLYGGDARSAEPYTVLIMDRDGIDIPRTVVDGNFDNRAAGDHDVAITSVTVNQTTAQIGKPVKITVIVENQGDFTETFNVTVYYDDTAAAPTQTVTDLSAAHSTTLEFTWDTTGVAEDTYTIKATASEVSDEVDISDNTFFDGDVTIKTEAALIHDVAVTSVTPSKTEAPIGETLSIDVKVQNKGDFSESFNVTVYYDDSPIGTQAVTDLASGQSQTLTFSWSTADIDAGTYPIRATAGTVTDETNTDDNSLTGSGVTLQAPATDNTLYIVAGIAIIGVVAVIAIYFLKLRKP